MTKVKPPKPISMTAYAKHRGCSVEAVRYAIRDKRLDESIVITKTGSGRDLAKITSLEAADKEWAANTRPSSDDPTITPQPEPNATDREMKIPEARRRKAVEDWKLAKIKREADRLDLDVKRGKLIPIDEAREDVIDEYTAVRTKLLGLPKRLQQRIPGFTVENVELADSLVREALEELSGCE